MKISDADRKKARALLQWLAFSARPMRLEEIGEAIVVVPGRYPFNHEDRFCDPSEVLQICSSLVDLSEDGFTLRLAHYSVKEYIISERILLGAASAFFTSETLANTLLGEVCLTYLLSFDKPIFLIVANFSKNIHCLIMQPEIGTNMSG